jgi:hypothetical protein
LPPAFRLVLARFIPRPWEDDMFLRNIGWLSTGHTDSPEDTIPHNLRRETFKSCIHLICFSDSNNSVTEFQMIRLRIMNCKCMEGNDCGLIYLEKLKKTRKTLRMLVSVPAGIWTGQFPNANQKRCRISELPPYLMQHIIIIIIIIKVHEVA